MTRFSRLAGALALALAVGSLSPLYAQGRTPGPARDSGLVAYDDDGLRVHSPDGRKQIKMRAYAVIDSRNVLGDSADVSPNGIVLRRSRIIVDANLYPGVAARVMYDIGPPSGTSPIQDAYIETGLWRGWWVRAGKHKTPFGLERYMSISSQLLTERSLASNLQAGRDLGVLFTGPVGGDAVEVSLGLFNGVADGGANQDADSDDAKDLTYRVWFKPYRHKTGSAEQGFGIAFNGTTGIERSALSAATRLPTFKTQALAPFFSYRESQGVRASGRHTRNGFFSYFHQGPFGAMGEWYSTTQVVSRAASVATVHTGGWMANVQYTLTGEPSAQEGIAPKELFNPDKGNWGAWQIGARAAAIDVGDEAFPLYADSTTAAHHGLALGVGLNWYITRQTKMQLAYEHTTFVGGAKVGNRRAEQYLQLRWQAYF